MATIAQVKANAKTLLEAVATTGVPAPKVYVKSAGPPPWTTRHIEFQNLWEIHLARRREQDISLGGGEYRVSTLRLEGWMPWSYENPDSTPLWDALLDDVCTKFRENRSLSDLVNDAELPQIVTNDYEALVGDDSGKEVKCHHAAIEVTVKDWQTYTTS